MHPHSDTHVCFFVVFICVCCLCVFVNAKPKHPHSRHTCCVTCVTNTSNTHTQTSQYYYDTTTLHWARSCPLKCVIEIVWSSSVHRVFGAVVNSRVREADGGEVYLIARANSTLSTIFVAHDVCSSLL
jgi:hypothetical protein